LGLLVGCNPDEDPESLEHAEAAPAEAFDQCAIPRCVRDLLTECPPDSVCSSETQGKNVSICYANGVQAQIERASGAASQVELTTTWKKRGGAICYSEHTSVSVDPVSGRKTSATILGRSGTAVGTIVLDADGATVTCNGAAPVRLSKDVCSGSELFDESDKQVDNCAPDTCG